jgi:hypothetical protein
VALSNPDRSVSHSLPLSTTIWGNAVRVRASDQKHSICACMKVFSSRRAVHLPSSRTWCGRHPHTTFEGNLGQTTDGNRPRNDGIVPSFLNREAIAPVTNIRHKVTGGVDQHAVHSNLMPEI